MNDREDGIFEQSSGDKNEEDVKTSWGLAGPRSAQAGIGLYLNFLLM